MTQVSDKYYAGGNLLYRYSSRKFTEGIKVCLNLYYVSALSGRI